MIKGVVENTFLKLLFHSPYSLLLKLFFWKIFLPKAKMFLDIFEADRKYLLHRFSNWREICLCQKFKFPILALLLTTVNFVWMGRALLIFSLTWEIFASLFQFNRLSSEWIDLHGCIKSFNGSFIHILGVMLFYDMGLGAMERH